MSLDSPVRAVNLENQSKRRRQLWFWIIFLSAFPLLALVIKSLDEPPPDIRDLLPHPLILDDADNAYVQLGLIAKSAIDALSLSPGDQTLLHNLVNEESGVTWDTAQIDSWLKILEPFWERQTAALNLSRSQGPNIQSYQDTIPTIDLISKFTDFSALRAEFHLRQNRPDEAFEVGLGLLQTGQRLEESHGSSIIFLIGCGIAEKGLNVIERAAQHPEISSALLLRAIAQMESMRAPPEALAQTFRAELVPTRALFADRANIGTLIEGSTSNFFQKWAPRVGLLYKPNRTMRIYAERLRTTLDYLGPDLTAVARLHSFERIWSEDPHPFNPDNLCGRFFFKSGFTNCSWLIRRYLRQQTRQSLDQALLAIRLYERDHGAAPSSLDVLVPDYLSAIPKDYADSAPVRYSAVLRVLWSAGEHSLVITSPTQKTGYADLVLFLDPQPATTTAP